MWNKKNNFEILDFRIQSITMIYTENPLSKQILAQKKGILKTRLWEKGTWKKSGLLLKLSAHSMIQKSGIEIRLGSITRIPHCGGTILSNIFSIKALTWSERYWSTTAMSSSSQYEQKLSKIVHWAFGRKTLWRKESKNKQRSLTGKRCRRNFKLPLCVFSWKDVQASFPMCCDWTLLKDHRMVGEGSMKTLNNVTDNSWKIEEEVFESLWGAPQI